MRDESVAHGAAGYRRLSNFGKSLGFNHQVAEFCSVVLKVFDSFYKSHCREFHSGAANYSGIMLAGTVTLVTFTKCDVNTFCYSPCWRDPTESTTLVSLAFTKFSENRPRRLCVILQTNQRKDKLLLHTHSHSWSYILSNAV